MDTAPAYPEEVTAGNPASPVAVVTLWTRQERILRGLPRELYAACGNLYSVWGISLLVKSVIARPTIRYLVVCGVDFADSGRALLALGEHGVTAEGTIVGTDTRLTVDASAIERFRQQVRLVDLRGCTRAAEVAAAIRALPAGAAAGAAGLGGATGPRSAAGAGSVRVVEPASAAAAHVADAGAAPADPAPALATTGEKPRRHGSRRAAAASSPGQSTVIPATRSGASLQPDPRGNFLIAVAAGEIVAAHATTTGGPTGQRFTGRTAAEVYRAILGADLVSRLDHAAYLGAELARAEIALRADVPYRQDSPLRLPGRP